ncbi:DUF3488 and transglutaminase-like domain-containing protein [Haloechinothrix sp. LS1_15]|uniref:transglutaminase family protein n=1 Tax=Haloechinothrix sp. LS1_15 TaxID=2652248 RepID=UPI002944760E|nr:DUF3488 and transglutaminase-like domain-containing protein [Haloechinothrix sp. LS1_15]MDV6012172.1 transglutaminase domain-containing protein [Haloechinothrix sp. LS1_15]
MSAPDTGTTRSRGRSAAAHRNDVLAGILAALATLASATALASVIAGIWWIAVIAVPVTLVTGTGVALRLLGFPAIVVGFAQLGVLACAVTVMFSDHGIAAVLPGPAALADLNGLILSAGDDIRTSSPPVEATAGILLLCTLAIGLVAILVDTLAVATEAPAAAGLALLCVYAVPASLSSEMLPWWSFVLGASAFALMITVHGNHRRWVPRQADRPRAAAAARSIPAPAALVSVAVVCGLLAGSVFTGIGTVGNLPGRDGQQSGSAGMGLDPFVSLRGMLEQNTERELFRVDGLDEERQLMRAFTLDTFRPKEGWTLADRDSLPAGVPATERLQVAGADPEGRTQKITIRPVQWEDVWLPIYGTPLALDGIGDGWYYDALSGAVFSEHRQQPPEYTVTALLPTPEAAELRTAAPQPAEPAPVYTELADVDPRIVARTEEITAGEDTPFDQVSALWQYFMSDGGFTYDTSTAPASDSDALVDFVLHGKRGFCQQFASAMAVMVRTLDIPARVALGFTSGEQRDGQRVITSRDAHAWVEVYFGEEHGWVAFDPTPLDDGRSTVPPYLEVEGDQPPGQDDEAAGAPEERAGENVPRDESGSPDAAASEDAHIATGVLSSGAPPPWTRWSGGVLLLLTGALAAAASLSRRHTPRARATAASGIPPRWLAAAATWLPGATAGTGLLGSGLLLWQVSGWLALAATVTTACVAAPWLLRDGKRMTRLHTLTTDPDRAPRAAWQEFLDECADRRITIGTTETARAAARRVADHIQLGSEAAEQLDTMVARWERAWYGPQDETARARSGSELATAFERLRHSLATSSPLPLGSRVLPPSVLTFRG